MNFVVAHHSEAKSIINQLGLTKNVSISSFQVFQNDHHKLIISGIGKVASRCSYWLLDRSIFEGSKGCAILKCRNCRSWIPRYWDCIHCKPNRGRSRRQNILSSSNNQLKNDAKVDFEVAHIPTKTMQTSVSIWKLMLSFQLHPVP